MFRQFVFTFVFWQDWLVFYKNNNNNDIKYAYDIYISIEFCLLSGIETKLTANMLQTQWKRYCLVT